MNIDWTAILTAIITLIGTIIVYVLVPFLKKKKQEAESNMSAEQRANFDYWTRVFIAAAESVYAGSNLGEKKADWVIAQLQKMGIEFDADTVRDAIMGMCRSLTAEGVINTNE